MFLMHRLCFRLFLNKNWSVFKRRILEFPLSFCVYICLCVCVCLQFTFWNFSISSVFYDSSRQKLLLIACFFHLSWFLRIFLLYLVLSTFTLFLQAQFTVKVTVSGPFLVASPSPNIINVVLFRWFLSDHQRLVNQLLSNDICQIEDILMLIGIH